MKDQLDLIVGHVERMRITAVAEMFLCETQAHRNADQTLLSSVV